MKKFIIFLGLSLLAFSLFAEVIPEKLIGIWEAKDRYVFFEQNDEEEPQIVIVLKEYYGWYYDRAAEPASYAEKEPRTRNIPTPRNAEHIYIKNISTKENSDSLYGSLDLYYSKSQKNTIPFFMLNDNIYLSYFEKDQPEVNNENLENPENTANSENPEDEISPEERGEITWAFYRGVAPSKGFLISPQKLPENITGYIIDGNKLYDVRYWFTDMDYSADYINFTYKDDSYQIPKHLRSCNTNYSCVSGRSKKVRNPVKAFEYKEEDFIYNSERSVFTKNQEPYLKRLADSKTFEALITMVKEANARRKPDPPALFPPSNLDWHWDLIDLLEKDNQLIKQVRARQKAFGPRAKDLEK